MVEHDAKFTSEEFRAFVKSMGSSLIVGSGTTRTHPPRWSARLRANGVISDMLRAYANGHKDD